MHDFRHAIVACVLLFGGSAGRPSCADPLKASTSEAQPSATDVDWTHTRHYDIILDEFHFAPSGIALQHGEPYAMRLENTGRFRHTFTAPEFFRAVAFRTGEAATEAEQAAGSFSLAAGEVKEIEFVPLQAGTYALECTKPLHGLFGMTGHRRPINRITGTPGWASQVAPHYLDGKANAKRAGVEISAIRPVEGVADPAQTRSINGALARGAIMSPMHTGDVEPHGRAGGVRLCGLERDPVGCGWGVYIADFTATGRGDKNEPGIELLSTIKEPDVWGAQGLGRARHAANECCHTAAG